MPVTYRMVTNAAYYDAAFARYRQQHPTRKYFDAIKWIGLVVLGGCLIMAIMQPAWPPMILLVGFIALICVSPQMERLYRTRRLRRSPYWNEDAELTFSTDGVETRSRLANLSATWDNFTRAVRFADGWLLFSGPQFFRWLPDAAIHVGSSVEIERLIDSYIDDVRRLRNA